MNRSILRALLLLQAATPLWLLLGLTPGAHAAPLQLTLDPVASQLLLSIDAFGKTDTQSSKLGGSISLDLDPQGAPTRVALTGFSMGTLTPMNFAMNFGTFVGAATAKVPLLELHDHGLPATPAYVPLSADAFTFTNVGYTNHGSGSYKVTGVICTQLQLAGRTCADAVDFDSGPPGVIDSMPGTVKLQNGVVRLDVTYFFTQPLDPTTPELATVSGVATVVATAPLPVTVALEVALLPGTQTLRLRWPKSATGATLVQRSGLATADSWQPV
ncbi:MAG TPA: hypothetical protein DCM86_08750, partial [Verrucomicrobiales bacterium]|nr:hypothetical protein [Verrucomicrobiales bacterium]